MHTATLSKGTPQRLIDHKTVNGPKDASAEVDTDVGFLSEMLQIVQRLSQHLLLVIMLVVQLYALPCQRLLRTLAGPAQSKRPTPLHMIHRSEALLSTQVRSWETRVVAKISRVIEQATKGLSSTFKIVLNLCCLSATWGKCSGILDNRIESPALLPENGTEKDAESLTCSSSLQRGAVPSAQPSNLYHAMRANGNTLDDLLAVFSPGQTHGVVTPQTVPAVATVAECPTADGETKDVSTEPTALPTTANSSSRLIEGKSGSSSCAANPREASGNGKTNVKRCSIYERRQTGSPELTKRSSRGVDEAAASTRSKQPSRITANAARQRQHRRQSRSQ